MTVPAESTHALCPVGHTETHEPALQVVPGTHARPHMPQFELSVCDDTQVTPHTIWSAVQIDVHTPAAQVVAGPQTRPHRPQLFSSVCAETHTPEHTI